MKKVLLLAYTYEPLNFINFKRAIRLCLNEKVDTVSIWEEKIQTAERELDFPSIIRLRKNYKIPRMSGRFNRKNVFRRDIYLCQYCGDQVSTNSATLDHILPTSRGGKNTWDNCVTSCFDCNGKKGNKTPDEVGMVLINEPKVPKRTINNDYYLENPKHPDWEVYFG